MKPLYPVQVKHAAVLATALLKHRAALDASATGTGKTLVAREIALQANRPTLVIAPKKALPQWRDELPKAKHINYEMLRTGRTEHGHWAPGKQWRWSIDPESQLIWDEGHKCKGMRTQNASMLISAKPFRNLILSATAVESPAEMRALGYILGLHSLRDFFKWAREHGCVINQWRGLDFINNPKILDALHRQIFPEHGSRMTLEDMKDHFQETQIITTPIDFGEELKSLYKEMENEIADLEAIIKSDSKGAEILTAQLRARQKTELLKVPTILEMTEDFLHEGRSIAVFVNFRATLEALRERFPDCGQIHGDNSKDHSRIIAEFQSDKSRVLLCMVQAGGESINLHDTRGDHSRVSIISPSWSAREIIQCMGRVHRAGGMTPSQQHILFAAGTIEEIVEKDVRRKIKNIGIFNDGGKLPLEISTKVCSILDTMAGGEETKHAEFSPSSLELMERCPGFRSRNNPSKATDRGTRIHKALETGSVHALDDENERQIAQMCQDHIDADIADRLPRHPDFDDREITLQMDFGAGVTTFGTPDRFVGYGDEGIMWDYKSGYREVSDADVNPQAWSYVIGGFQKKPQLSKLTFTFLIPNRDEVLSHTFGREDVPKMLLRLNTIIRRAQEASPRNFSPQPELCEYCSRQTSCPALAKKTLEFARKMRPELIVPSTSEMSPDNPDDVAHLLRIAPFLEATAKGIREQALRLNLEDGLEIPGFKRIERSTPRGVNSVLGAWEAVRDKISLPDFLAACSSVSVPQLEDLFSSQAKRGEKGKAKKEVESRLRHADVLIEEGTRYYLKEEKK